MIEGPARAVLGVVTGNLDVKSSVELGLTMRGQRKLIGRLAPPVS